MAKTIPIVDYKGIAECGKCGMRKPLNSIGYCIDCSKPQYPDITRGFIYTHGIWDRNHSINSRDIANPEIFSSRDLAEKAHRGWIQNYARTGYEIWFYNIVEIDVRSCPACGHLAEKNSACLYCWTDYIVRKGNDRKTMIETGKELK